MTNKNNDTKAQKGNGSERKHEQDGRTDQPKRDTCPEDLFGAKKPTEQDGILSSSGDYVLWINDRENIYVEQFNRDQIPRRKLNYIKRLEDGGPARDVFRESESRVEICLDRWIISRKEETGNDKNEVGDAEDLLPIIVEAL
jgi:hypothetical protein